MNVFVIPGLIVAVAAAIRGMWSPCGLSMISSITPLSERGRGHRFWVTAAWFTLGGIAGGATTGAAMALGAWAVSAAGAAIPTTVALFAVAALVTIASDLNLWGFSLPLHARQVNETWLRRLRAWAYASGFGWQIGTGFATYIMTGGVYLTVAAGVLSGDPRVAFGLGVAFGLVRGLLVFVAAGATDHGRLQRLHARIERLTDVSLTVTIAAQIVALAVLALTSGLPVVAIAVLPALNTTVVVLVGRSRHARSANNPVPVTLTRM